MMESGQRFGCPYCGSAFTDRNVCPRCGTICDRCGTPYKGSYCTRCYGREAAYIAPGTNPQGEVAPARYDGIVRPKLDGGGSVSRREANFLDSTFLKEGSKEIHDKAEKAVRFLRLPDEAKKALAEQIERAASKLMKSSGGEINRERAVLHALYVGAKDQGIPTTEVQECLARSGFRMSLYSVTVRVECEGPDSIEVFVNGSPRKARAAVIGGSEGETMRKIAWMIGRSGSNDTRDDVVFCSVKVPLLLGDALDSEGDVLVHFSNASIIDFPPDLKAEVVNDDQSTLKLTLDPKKCFTYYRLLKEVALNPSTSSPAAGPSQMPSASPVIINPDRFIRRYLNIEARYPVSSMLANTAGCTQRLRSLAMAEFRRSVANANGRSPQTLAIESLYFSDREVFRSLPGEIRSRVRVLALKTATLPRDRSYAGVEGVLLPSELGRDPPPEKDGLQTATATAREGGR